MAGEKALPEMGFTLGGVDELIDPRVRLLYAVDGNGKVLGVTSWLPTYRDGKVIGWTLDFMRHRTDSVNGIMEFLIARMAERLRDDDSVEFMSCLRHRWQAWDPTKPKMKKAKCCVTSCKWSPTLWNRHTDSIHYSVSN